MRSLSCTDSIRRAAWAASLAVPETDDPSGSWACQKQPTDWDSWSSVFAGSPTSFTGQPRRGANGPAHHAGTGTAGADTAAAIPAERRVRHLLDVARAYSQTGRNDAGLTAVLEAERLAPELVRHHYIGRQLVLTWVRNSPGRPSVELDRLARRLRIEG